MKWAAETAVNLNTTVPWVMCAQEDAPDSVVSVYAIHDGLFHLLLTVHSSTICTIFGISEACLLAIGY